MKITADVRITSTIYYNYQILFEYPKTTEATISNKIPVNKMIFNLPVFSHSPARIAQILLNINDIPTKTGHPNMGPKTPICSAPYP